MKVGDGKLLRRAEAFGELVIDDGDGRPSPPEVRARLTAEAPVPPGSERVGRAPPLAGVKTTSVLGARLEALGGDGERRARARSATPEPDPRANAPLTARCRRSAPRRK